jgi:hypothetical protein
MSSYDADMRETNFWTVRSGNHGPDNDTAGNPAKPLSGKQIRQTRL